MLGGTFDPVHNGHIAIAEEARTRLNLDEVVFMPAAVTPFKEEYPLTPAGQRVKMVELAIGEKPYFRLSTIELEREGPSYTVDTLYELRDLFGEDTGIFFIMGCDSLASFPRWKEPGGIIDMCRLVAVPRPGCSVPDMVALEKEVPGISGRVTVLDGPNIDISSSDIRERVSKGQPVSELLPGPVDIYIKEHGLYLKA